MNSVDLDRLHATLTCKHRMFRYFTQSECPATLLECFARELPHIPAESWPERFAWGGVHINGVPVHADTPLTAPTKVEYYEPKGELKDAHRSYAEFSTDDIVYEDEDLIAAFKPPRLPSVQTREQHHHYLQGYIEAYLGHAVHAPSRLDTSAQGLVVMSKSKRMNKHLQQVFERHQIEKYYVIEVSPKILWQRKLVENRIGEDPRHTILRRVVDSGGDAAITHFKLLYHSTSEGAETSVILAKPRTGRTHQLRVHASHLGHPIVGDNFYNGIVAPELHLLCLRVKFHNPLRKEIQEIQLPEKFLPVWLKPEAVVKTVE